jgi:hypothetical protein
VKTFRLWIWRAAPQISALEVPEGKTGNTLARDSAEFLSQLMSYSASISASKRGPSTRAIYFLGVNTSSGKLHAPNFTPRGLIDWSDGLVIVERGRAAVSRSAVHPLNSAHI